MELADAAANRINDWIEANEAIFITSHLDADGITAAGIIGTALARRNAIFHLRITRQLDQIYLSDLLAHSTNHYIFCDLGSGQLPQIKEALDDAEIVILDHHPIAAKSIPKNIRQVNPHECGFDGTYEYLELVWPTLRLDI